MYAGICVAWQKERNARIGGCAAFFGNTPAPTTIAAFPFLVQGHCCFDISKHWLDNPCIYIVCSCVHFECPEKCRLSLGFHHTFVQCQDLVCNDGFHTKLRRRVYRKQRRDTRVASVLYSTAIQPTRRCKNSPFSPQDFANHSIQNTPSPCTLMSCAHHIRYWGDSIMHFDRRLSSRAAAKLSYYINTSIRLNAKRNANLK